MAASLKDVANLAKVSLTTASFALNGKPVKEETRQRVLEAARKVHYYVNVKGRNLSTKRTHNISLVILNQDAAQDYTTRLSYYYPLLKGVMDHAQKNQYSVKYEVVAWDTITKTDYFERIVYGRSVDGIIVVPQYKYSCSFTQLFDEEKFPYVIINPWFETPRKHKVMVDNYDGGFLVSDYIVKKGFQKIFLIEGPQDHINSGYIEKGFIAGLLQNGVRFDISHIIFSDYTFEGGKEASEKLIKEHDLKGSVIFCLNDYMAAGAMVSLRSAGYDIPGDVSVIGFDGMDVAKCAYPPITTMDVDTGLLGTEAAKRLLGLIEGKMDPRLYREIILSPVLTEGGTVRHNK